MLEHRILKYFRPITGNRATPEHKDPPEGKKLPNASGSLSKVLPSSTIASCNAEVTKVLKAWNKQDGLLLKILIKLTPAQR